MVSTDDDINTNNNETQCSELRAVYEEPFEIKFQEVFALMYMIFEFFNHLLVSLFIRLIASRK